MKVASVSSSGELLDERAFETDVNRGASAIIADIASAVRALDAKGQAVIGIGVAGQVERETGKVLFGPNLNWVDVPLGEELCHTLHQPVAVLNDVRAHTFGEWLHGAGRNCDDFVCLFLGTGIGGGIVSGGHMLTGATNAAGEIGHMVVNPHGPRCSCGNVGCLEAFAGGASLAKQACEVITESPLEGRTLLQLARGDLKQVTAKLISQAYAEGDPLAKSLVDRAGQALVTGCVNIVHICNPKRLILGGGLLNGLPHFINQVEQGVRKVALRAAVDHLEVVEAQLGNDAAVVGSAAFARMQMR